MEYLLFTLQIIIGGYFLTNKVATTLKFGYLIYLFIVVVSIILFYLMFKMEFSKLVITILTFVFGAFLTRVTHLFNLIPFVTLYFYVIDRLKENGVFKAKYYLYLSFIILLGLVPIEIPGIFEKNLTQIFVSIISSIFSMESSNTQYPNPNPQNNIFNQIQNAFKENATVDTRFTGFSSLFSLIFSIAVLVLLVLLFVSVVKIQNKTAPYKKKRFNRVLLYSATLIISSILIVLVSFTSLNSFQSTNPGKFNFWVALSLFSLFVFILTSFKIYRYYIEPEHYFPKDPKVLSTKTKIIMSLSFTVLVVSNVIAYIFFRQRFFSAMIISLSTLFIAFIFYYTLSLQGEIAVYTNHPIFKKSEQIISNYEKYGEEYLNRIENPKEFIIYLYFLSILNFEKANIKMADEMTPKEFLETVKPCLKSNIFELLTSAFYLAEYSKNEIDENTINFLRKNADKLLSEIKELKNTTLSLETIQ
jgi:hypothetical protein